MFKIHISSPSSIMVLEKAQDKCNYSAFLKRASRNSSLCHALENGEAPTHVANPCDFGGFFLDLWNGLECHIFF